MSTVYHQLTVPQRISHTETTATPTTVLLAWSSHREVSLKKCWYQWYHATEAFLTPLNLSPRIHIMLRLEIPHLCSSSTEMSVSLSLCRVFINLLSSHIAHLIEGKVRVTWMFRGHRFLLEGSIKPHLFAVQVQASADAINSIQSASLYAVQGSILFVGKEMVEQFT
jgi:hypothetical protein